jgi:uncharacterized caspase-like protein/predicted GTPase
MGKYALLIGVGEYGEGLTSLPAAPRDVAAFAEVLQSPQMCGFDHVKPVINPNQAQMAREIELWFRGREPDDLVLLFFSGHGVKDDRRELFFAACNTEKQRDALIRSTATSAQFIHDCIRRCKAKYQVIILDCCFSGAFGNQLARDDGEINLKDQLGAEGQVVLTATNEVGYAFEEKGTDLSIYTRYLVEGIVSGAADEDEDGVITVEELHRFAGRKVEETSPAMSPKIITLKDEGYRIRLARSPQDDPKVKYRKEAERRVASGQFSIPAKRLLRLRRQELGISDAEAEVIESEVLKPFQEYQRKRQVYEETFQECLQAEAKLSPNVIRDLMDLRDHLGLRAEDVSAIDQTGALSPSLLDNTDGHTSSLPVSSTTQPTNTSQSPANTVGHKSSTPASPPLQKTAARSLDAPPDAFQDFRKVLVTLINDLEQLRKYSQVLLLNNSVQRIEDVLEKVQSSSFSIAIVGEFMRGKTTLINALLGQEILPTDILPCSASVCRVIYGVTLRMRIVYKDGREEEITIDQFVDYVTKLTPDSEATTSQVKESILYYPTPYCQNDVNIIDTPGFTDDVIATEIVPSVDAVIMVIMAQDPFSEFEANFVETKLLTSDLGRIIFVVNGIDRLSPKEINRHIKYVRDRIWKLVLQPAKEQYGEDSPEYEVYRNKIGHIKICGLSASQALQAKQTGDRELLAKSRFPEFEAALEKFLTQERGSTFLQVPINRLIASSTEILSAPNLQQNTSSTLSEQQKREISQMTTETRRILNNAHRLSKQLIQEVNVGSVDSSTSKTQSPPPESLDDDLSSECNVDYTRLRDFLKAQQWQESNQETKRVMLQVADCEKEGWLDSNAIDCFPITDLRTIDQLWVKYSNGRFGFSVQRRIFQQVNQQEREFMQTVHWTQASLKGGIFSEENRLNFSIEAPEGHLPMVFGGEHGWIFSVL